MQKAVAQRLAAELGLIIVAPDTSPRGEQVPGDPDGAWDFGLGAGLGSGLLGSSGSSKNPGAAGRTRPGMLMGRATI